MADRDVLRAAARLGLAEPSLPPPRLKSGARAGWQGVARIDRLGGLLVNAAESGAIVADDDALQAATTIWHQQLVVSVVVEALVVRTAEVLDDAGITWALTKGAAVAHLDYADPTLRAFGDADVLIHPDHWEGAVAALHRAGCRRKTAEVDAEWDNRFGKGATLRSPEGLEIDLHRRFAIGRFGVRSRMAELYEHRESITLAGRQIPTLDGPGRLLHSCHHAALGGFRHYRAHRDIAQQLLVRPVDWPATVDIALRWGVEAVVARAVDDTWRVLDLPVEHPALAWARTTRISWADRRALDIFAAEKPFRHQAMTAVGAMPWRDVPAYLRPLAARPGALRRLTRRLPWR